MTHADNADVAALHDQQRRRAQLQILSRLRDAEGRRDSGNSNTYKVVVAASDNALGAETTTNAIKVAYKKVTVMVTKVEETETVTLSAEQGQVDVELTATL